MQELLQTAVSFATLLATLVGVPVAIFQLMRQVAEHKTAFEDSFAKEYRELVATIPVSAMLGESLNADTLRDHLDEFYHYFDLCNEQAFLAKHRRVRRKTWEFWEEGIVDNLKRSAFLQAWEIIQVQAPNDFTALRKVLRKHGIEA
jgi:hypothetical protein